MRASLLVLFLVSQLLIVPGCHPAPQGQLYLSEALEWSDDQNLVAHEGSLGSLQANSYLSGRWGPPLADGSIVPLDARSCLVRFFLKEPVPLQLEIEGFQHNRAPVLFSQLELNDVPLEALQLKREKETFTFILPLELLKAGQNTLRFGPRKDSRWANFRLRPVAEPLPFDPESLAKVVGPEHTLCIPYSGSRQFTLALKGSTTLRIDSLGAWDEEGAPPAESFGLKVRLSHRSGYLETRELGPGDSLRLKIPADLDRVSACLTAICQGSPLKGQLGVTLGRPRLEYGSSLAATPTATPLAASGPVQSPPTPPNLVIYLIDTLRADHLSCYGYHRPTSPHIDRLAEDGFLFRRVSANSPWTKPATATILTGLHPREHGATDWGDILPNEVETVAEILLARGYETRAFVTNGFASSLFNITQGFSEETLLLETTSEEVGLKVATWLEQRQDTSPFFLYVHTLDPHSPYAPPESFNRWTDRRLGIETQQLEDESLRLAHDPQSGAPSPPTNLTEAINLYDGEISANDDSFGQLVKQLKDRGLYDDTVIIVISDHGEEFFEHRGFGHCRTLYPEVLEVPWVMKYPGQLGAGTIVMGDWQHTDVAPTALAALGVEPSPAMKGLTFDPKAPQIPGRRPIFLHADLGPDNGFLEHDELLCLEGVRQDSWLYLRHQAQTRPAAEPEELYHLSVDPTASSNLRESRSDRMGALRILVKGLNEFLEVAIPKKIDAEQLERVLRDLQYL